MKKFTTAEVRDLYGQVTMGKITFSRMAKVINQRMSETSEPQYKDGDFVYKDGRVMIVKSYPCTFHANAWPIFSDTISYNGTYAVNFSEPTFRYATAEEKQELIELLKKDGKQWNAEKMVIEDIPVYKDGDFVVNVMGSVLIFREKVEYQIYDHAFFNNVSGSTIVQLTPSYSPIRRHATEEEKQELLDTLAKEGKRWNEEKKCVEDIPVRKFKKGDKVMLKSEYQKADWIITHLLVSPDYIGKPLTVVGYIRNGYICLDKLIYSLPEEWLEPYSEPQYKNGDFVVGFGCVFILHTQIDKYSAQYHALYAKTNGNVYYYRTYSQLGGIDKLRLTTEEEKQELLNALAKEGKRWNAEKLCIENMQVRKFKIGDKVRIKHGVSSRTHGSIRPFFAYSMDKLIGKELTVEYCDSSEYVICDGYSFLKEWLEPYVEESKKDDEDIPKRKFKKGDKVRIKKGVSSRTHCTIGLSFMKEMDELIGKTMTVYSYTDWHNYVECEGIEYAFLEEWLEPYEELKKGDLAIFWDEAKRRAIIRIYDQLDESEDYL